MKEIDEPLIQIILETNFQNLTFYGFGDQVYFYSEYVGADYETETGQLFSDESFRSLDDDLKSLLKQDSQKRTWIPMIEVFHTD